jgi:hypothetical protein
MMQGAHIADARNLSILSHPNGVKQVAAAGGS